MLSSFGLFVVYTHFLGVQEVVDYIESLNVSLNTWLGTLFLWFNLSFPTYNNLTRGNKMAGNKETRRLFTGAILSCLIQE